MPITVHIEAERKRVEAVVETLAAASRGSNSRAALSHDARNMVTALTLYCDLLEQPGVLSDGFQHYAQELRLVSDASRCLVDKLADLEHPRMSNSLPDNFTSEQNSGSVTESAWPLPAGMPPSPEECIANFAEELEGNRNLLDAIAGLGVAISMHIRGGAAPVRMHGEDLTRLLVNLVKNAAEAMHGAGSVHLELTERAAESGRWLVLTIDDTGPGIPAGMRQKIFEAGYTTHPTGSGGWTGPHRGLGLAICGELARSAGGSMRVAARRAPGARFVLELPLSHSDQTSDT